MTNKIFKGTYTAIVTPFDSNDKIDFKSFEKLVELQIKGNVSGIVFVGTTGESPTLSKEEHIEILNWSVKAVKGRCQVIAGTGSNSTKEAIYYSKMAEKAGADGIMLVNPYYNKPSQQGLYLHFSTIASEVNLPIIIYNIKGRTAINVETSTLLRLSKIKNIVAVKEASGNISQMMDVINQSPQNFSCLSGDDELTLPLIAAGGDGVISVASNYLPAKVSEFVNSCLSGDFIQGRKHHYELLKILRDSFLETNPIPAKEILGLLGLIEANLRLPLCRASNNTMEKLKLTVEEIKAL